VSESGYIVFEMLNARSERMDGYRALAGLLKAMSHPTRLQILDILAQGEACVCHLTAILQQRQPYVSQHLMILREAGLVADRKDGVMVYYRLADGRLPAVQALAREMLAAMGQPVAMPTIPPVPVPGCPCPHCGGQGTC
jgi:DNA-binding transcriptional ArsR family regulator